MADLDKLEANVGDIVRLCDGEKGVIRTISTADDNVEFDRFQIELNYGKIVTEARYRFDVIPPCPGRDMRVAGGVCKTVSHTMSEIVTISQDVNVNDHVQNSFSDDSLDDFDLNRFFVSEVNKNTKKKTDGDVMRVHDYLQNVLREVRSIESIPPAHLNKLLCIFFMNVRNLNGQEYEPASVRVIACSLDRYLKYKDYGKQLSISPVFSNVMDVIRSKQKKLKRGGKGNRENRADAISDVEIDKLYESGQLGSCNAESLLRTIWWNNTVYFGMRGVIEHRNMQWGDVKLCKDTESNEYLEFRERQTKTRPGSNPKNVRAVPPRAWATPDNPSRCPVATYKTYQAHRPLTYCNPDAPYYIASNTNPDKSSKWFKSQPVGVNKLGTFMKTMAENAGLMNKSEDNSSGKRLTNHSARKYLVQKLNDKGLPPNQIMQISGHKNIQSINSYSTINTNQHRTISRAISSSSDHVGDRPFTSTPRQSDVIVKHPNFESTVSSNPTGALSAIFAGPIHGGSFTININNINVCKRPRPWVLYSDSESG